MSNSEKKKSRISTKMLVTLAMLLALEAFAVTLVSVFRRY